MFDAIKKLGDVAGGIIFKESETVAKPATVSKPVVGGFASSQPSGNVAMTPVVNQDMINELKKVVTLRVSAFTTLEERASAMASAIPDETMRTRAAFGLLAASGRSASDIIKAIDIHLMDIDSEEVRFTHACTAAKQDKSGAVRTEISNLEKQFENDNQVIAKMREQIREAEDRVQATSLKITESRDKVSQIESEFDAKIAAFSLAASTVKDSLSTRKTALSSMLS